jgi:hypothetical protein
MRLISFLPAATEMVFALGLGDRLVGVSHECDFPAPAKTKPVVVKPGLPLEKMLFREIDTAVAERIGSGQNLYQVDERLLEQLAPTHILTQVLCQVCAPSGNDITRYCCGHWVPEMVELAGGEEALGCKGADSVRISWTEIAALSPEILIVSPCGFGLEAAVQQAKQLLQQPGWNGLPAVLNDRVFAVDANAYFSRPGLRVVDGVELLAHLIHPELCDWRGGRNAFEQIHSSDILSGREDCPECGAEFSCGPKAGRNHCG